MRRLIWLSVGLLLGALASVASAENVNVVLDGIRQVETGGLPNGGYAARGDEGKARGPFQIHYVYWRDSGVPGKWEDCDGDAYSRRVVLAYWKRHCPGALKSGDVERLARVHNGGPKGNEKAATVPYFKRVEKAIAKIKRNKPTTSRQ